VAVQLTEKRKIGVEMQVLIISSVTCGPRGAYIIKRLYPRPRSPFSNEGACYELFSHFYDFVSTLPGVICGSFSPDAKRKRD